MAVGSTMLRMSRGSAIAVRGCDGLPCVAIFGATNNAVTDDDDDLPSFYNHFVRGVGAHSQSLSEESSSRLFFFEKKRVVYAWARKC